VIRNYANIPIKIYCEYRIEDKVASMHNVHYHDCNEIYYLVNGERNYLIDKKLYRIHAGDLVLIPKNILHKTSAATNKGCERFLINIYDECLNDEVKACFNNYCYHIPPKYNSELAGYFRNIEKEYSENDEFRHEMLEAKIYVMLIFLLRIKRKNSSIIHSNSYDERTNLFIQYICEHFSEQITLQSVAEHFFLSKEYFSLIFKQKTGFGFNEYLNQLRISYAMKLLENTDESIISIANKCGYNDSSYFAAVFKKVSGVSPKNYRKKK